MKISKLYIYRKIKELKEILNIESIEIKIDEVLIEKNAIKLKRKNIN